MPEPTRFLENFVPENYSLSYKINKNDETFACSEIISGEAKNSKIFLHSVGLKVKSLEVNGSPVEFEVNDEKITIKNLEPGKVKIEIEISGRLSHNMEGIYVSTYRHNNKTEKIIATQFESHYARTAFPCIDEPAAKATFDLKISYNDQKATIISNAPSKTFSDASAENTSEGTLKTVEFETTPRMSTYLLAFACGEFNEFSAVSRKGIKITSYASKAQSPELLKEPTVFAGQVLDWYAEKFQADFPLPELKQLALPDFEAGAMENWGLVTYRESMFLYDKTTSLGLQKTAMTTIAHELSHQWFGDLVTMSWWDDLWLNESFANIMEYYAVDALRPDLDIFEDFFTGDCLAALNRDAYLGVQSVHQDVETPAEIDTLFDGAIVYAKGARLIFMLVRELGWENFLKGLRDYFQKYAYENTSGSDLWKSLQSYADFDVAEFMNSWINQPGYPVLKKSEGFEPEGERTNRSKTSRKTGSSEKFTEVRFLLSGKPKNESWPIPKVMDDMSGHYLISLSDSELKAKLDNFDNLGLEQKLRLLIDQRFLAKTPAKNSAELFSLLEKIKTESDPSLWDIASIIISDLKLFLRPDSSEEMQFKNFVAGLVRKPLEKVGLVKTSPTDRNIELRSTLLSLALYSERENGENDYFIPQLAELYSDSGQSLPDFCQNFDADSRFAVLSALIKLDPKYFSELLGLYKNTPDPDLKYDLLGAIAGTTHPEHFEKLFKLLESPDVIRPQDHFSYFYSLVSRPRLHDKAFDWLIENWSYVETLCGDASLDYYPRYLAKTIKTPEDEQKYFDFFENLKNPLFDRLLEVAHGEISARLALIASDQQSVISRLNEERSRIDA